MKERILVHESPALAADRRWVQFFLRLGLWISGFLMALGLLVNLVWGNFQTRGIRMDALLDPDLGLGNSLLTWGVFVLAMTPAFRVLMLTILWTREKDWRFVGVAILVIATLCLSMWLGGR